MNKEFIPYEQILELKELGFNGILWQEAFRWFREEYGWVGGIRKLSSMGNNKIVGEFYKDDDNSFIMFGETYEECELRALKYLIELFKNK